MTDIAFPNPLKIAPGTYKLTKDVQNPKPDRRSPRDWHKSPTWKAGTVYVVHGEPEVDLADVADDESLRGKKTRNRHQHITAVGRKTYDIVQCWADTERWNALVAAFEPVTEIWGAFIQRLGIRDSNEDFLRWLVHSKFLTRAQLETAWEEWNQQSGDWTLDEGVEK